MKTKNKIITCIIGIGLLFATPVFTDPVINLWDGVTLNGGFTIFDSNRIIFEFLHDPTDTDPTEIDLVLPLPLGNCTLIIEKEGGSCTINDPLNSGGSNVTIFGPLFDSGSLMVEYVNGPTTISDFLVDIATTGGSLGNWDVSLVTNADFQFVRAIPDIEFDCPTEVFSEQAGVTLDASASQPLYVGTIDPAPAIATYAWTQTAGPAVSLTGADTATPTFDAPDVDVDTELTFQVTVTDDAGLSAIETVTVLVKAFPIVQLGPSLNDGFNIYDSDQIIFGFYCDPALGDADIPMPSIPASSFIITKNGFPCTIGNSTGCQASTVVVPGFIDTSGSITVSGGSAGTFSIDVMSSAGSTGIGDWAVDQPTNADIQFAQAIPNIMIDSPTQVYSGQAGITLDASASQPIYLGTIDPAPLIESYSWTQTDGPSVSLIEANTATPTFDAPIVDVDTEITFQVTVTDDAGLVSIRSITIPVIFVNNAPGAPTLVSPESGQIVTTEDGVLLKWKKATDVEDGEVENYRLYVATDEAFNNIVAEVEFPPAGGNLLMSGIIAGFMLLLFLSGLKLFKQSRKALVLFFSLFMVFNFMACDMDMINAMLTDTEPQSGITDEMSYLLDIEPDGTVYYWKVAAEDSGGVYSESAVRSFTY